MMSLSSEIENAINKLKNGKAAECDNIPPEAIKVGGRLSQSAFPVEKSRLVASLGGTGTRQVRFF